jgi:hypothetical protein
VSELVGDVDRVATLGDEHDADLAEALPARGAAAGRGGASVERQAVSVETALDADAVTRHQSS